MKIATQKISRLLAWVLSLAFVASFLLRVTIKDHWAPVAFAYYATPTILVALSAFLAALCWLVAKSRKRARVFFLAALLCSLWWYQTAYFNNPSQSSQLDSKVVYWNIGRGKLGYAPICRQLRSFDADVVAVAEVGYSAKQIKKLRETFADYESTGQFHQMMVFCRGEILSADKGALNGKVPYWLATVKTKDDQFRLVVLDMFSSPFLDRQYVFDALNTLVEQLDDQPLIVVGDFNTPADSIHFRGLRERLKNAFEITGQGHSATWPVPLPVLHLDQAWVNQRIRLAACQLGWAIRSDHRPLVVYLDTTTRLAATQ